MATLIDWTQIDRQPDEIYRSPRGEFIQGHAAGDVARNQPMPRGRKPLGDRPLTGAELHQRRHRVSLLCAVLVRNASRFTTHRLSGECSPEVGAGNRLAGVDQ
jgi:hypothetical protein